ncbi:type IV toxin-antitoxin system AbiEi family antitoxin [Flavivirga sp. 57AJ16]|uniref:type IV toxin-antitoxin system AbiEi family antitoxin n=1 Tax=Flavivirga sp. 57AJ16 TaxID=3025307 RepID=UPI0023670EFB|nr:type IV toxin-antitoxin system AbiEi family antitoxin [Flavivirga sp. 57AJ16]MDD7886002.1 type IV toxin-antitoxin system AbiEi family antitoxin [Flavivirga sp. 57AJ16]
MTDFAYIQEFFDTLDFHVEVIYQNYNHEKKESIYTLNNEMVYIDTKNEVRPQNIAAFEKKRSQNLPLLIASKYITPKSKNILKEKKINYIDSFGNAYINLEHLKIYVEQGNAKPYYSDYSNLLTQTSGQIIFQLLKNPEQINETQRYLSLASKVSLGSVSKCITALIDEGFVVKWNNEQKYQLVRRDELLDKWITILNQKILPANKIGKYSFSKQNNANWKAQFLNTEALWAGEPAAALITNYLNPEAFTLFTEKKKSEILTVLKLIPDSKGDITLYQPFWIDSFPMERVANINHKNVVHPLIIYAQLIYSNNTRNIEAAQLIYNEYIKPNL